MKNRYLTLLLLVVLFTLPSLFPDNESRYEQWSKSLLCDLCNKPDKIHYRVKSVIYRDWIFCCKECWIVISKHNDYSYGGTRKSKK